MEDRVKDRHRKKQYLQVLLQHNQHISKIIKTNLQRVEKNKASTQEPAEKLPSVA